jgi:hypothetical protein
MCPRPFRMSSLIQNMDKFTFRVCVCVFVKCLLDNCRYGLGNSVKSCKTLRRTEHDHSSGCDTSLECKNWLLAEI